MLKPETYRLEAVIGELFTARTEWDADLAAAWHIRALETLHQLKKRIASSFLNAPKDTALRRHLHYHQSLLTELSDRLFKRLNDRATAPGHDHAHVAHLLEDIEASLRKAQRYFSGFFDDLHPLTRYRQQQQLGQLRLRLNALQSPYDDPELVSLLGVISRSLEQLLAGDEYVQPSYQDEFQVNRFLALTSRTLAAPGINAAALFDRLYLENFNSSPFAEWYQQQLLHALSVTDPQGRDSKLAAEAQRLSITGNRPRAAFDRQREDITETLPAWLSRLRDRDPSQGKGDSAAYRLPLDLSVAQFGHFLRLCYLTGCFHEQNISEVLRFFVQHFTSKKQDHISAKSLAKAFYGAEQTTAASSRAWLQRMIDHINKKYFPK